MRSEADMAQIEAIARRRANSIGCFSGFGEDDLVTGYQPMCANGERGQILQNVSALLPNAQPYWKHWWRAAEIAFDLGARI